MSFVKYRTGVAQTANTEQSLSSEANSRLGGEEILHILWIQMDYCPFDSNLSLDSTQIQLNSVNILKTYFLEVSFNITLLYRSTKCLCFKYLQGTG